MRRVIDIVEETEDRREPVEDWSLLVTPLAEILKIEATDDIDALYIRQSTNNKASIISTNESADKIMPLRTEDADVKSKLTIHRSEPVVFVGEAGVGKTSWLKYFNEVILKDEKFLTFYYDQKIDFHVPVGLQTDPKDRFERIFCYRLIYTLKEQLTNLGISGTDIHSIESESIIDYSNSQLLSLYTTFSKEIKRVHEEHGIMLFIAIDNLDQFDAELQERGFKLSVWLGAREGIVSFVTLRPDTLHSYLFTQNIFNPSVYQITPPSIKQLFYSRLNYLWSESGASRLKYLREFLAGGVNIDLSYTGLVEPNEIALEKLYKRIGNVLCEIRDLENALYSLHNYNIRSISNILSSIILTKDFSIEYIEGRNVEDSVPQLRKPEKLITSYLRGIYGHYRGGTAAYPVANISLFSDTTGDQIFVMLGIRILQMLAASRNIIGNGQRYDYILSTLKSIGYAEDDIKTYLCILSEREFIVECHRQAIIKLPEDIEYSDHFRLQPAGYFVLTKLLLNYAFRYCEAVADICPHSRSDGAAWATDKSFLSMAENALGILDLIISSAEHERCLAVEKDSSSKSSKFTNSLKHVFYSSASQKDEIVHVMTSDCIGRVNFFEKNFNFKRSNFDASTAFGVIINHKIPSLKDRVSKLRHFG